MKEYYLSNVKIIERENKELEDEDVLKNNLIHLYDVINEAAASLPEEITKKWFYTDEQINEMKKDENYKFI